jgi:hypothetical protein
METYKETGIGKILQTFILNHTGCKNINEVSATYKIGNMELYRLEKHDPGMYRALLILLKLDVPAKKIGLLFEKMYQQIC